jgi:hypothetical protein
MWSARRAFVFHPFRLASGASAPSSAPAEATPRGCVPQIACGARSASRNSGSTPSSLRRRHRRVWYWRAASAWFPSAMRAEIRARWAVSRRGSPETACRAVSTASRDRPDWMRRSHRASSAWRRRCRYRSRSTTSHASDQSGSRSLESRSGGSDSGSGVDLLRTRLASPARCWTSTETYGGRSSSSRVAWTSGRPLRGNLHRTPRRLARARSSRASGQSAPATCVRGRGRSWRARNASTRCCVLDNHRRSRPHRS